MTLARNYPIQLAPLQKSEELKDEQNGDGEDNFDDERTIPVHPVALERVSESNIFASRNFHPSTTSAALSASETSRDLSRF